MIRLLNDAASEAILAQAKLVSILSLWSLSKTTVCCRLLMMYPYLMKLLNCGCCFGSHRLSCNRYRRRLRSFASHWGSESLSVSSLSLDAGLLLRLGGMLHYRARLGLRSEMVPLRFRKGPAPLPCCAPPCGLADGGAPWGIPDLVAY